VSFCVIIYQKVLYEREERVKYYLNARENDQESESKAVRGRCD